MPKAESTKRPGKPAVATPAQRTGIRILQWILDEGLSPGAPLTGQRLADALGLSRFPVQQALAQLEQVGMVHRPSGRGYAVKAGKAGLSAHVAGALKAQGLSPYLRIARDRLKQVLPKEITESELAKRYGLTRMQLGPVLNRMAQEGWIRRKSGNGWFFTELIDSKQAHEDSYVFRMTIEPAALLAPGFRVDSAALQRLRTEQTALRDGRLGRITSEELFEIGARFHETLIGFSRNEFFVAALARVNQRRRLVEYEAMAHPADFIEQCHEHLTLLDLIERGDRQEASAFLRRHLDIVRGVKLRGVSQADLIPHF